MKSFAPLFLLIFSLLSLQPTLLLAQEATPEATPTVEEAAPAEESNNDPTPEATIDPTAEATLEPTVEATLDVTAEPTPEVTTEATPEPTIEATVEATAEATTEVTLEPSVPPVFNVTQTWFDAIPGQPLEINLSVSDDAGIVRVVEDVSATLGGLSVAISEPTESAAPFNTGVTVTYLPPADYAASDSFQLTAIDGAGEQASISVQINILAPESESLLAEDGLMADCTINVAAGDAAGLIAAINSANSNTTPDTICLGGGTYTLTEINYWNGNGANGLPYIPTEITIEGNGSIIQREGTAVFRFLEVTNFGVLTINDVTFNNGAYTVSGSHTGGGSSSYGASVIYNWGSTEVNRVNFINSGGAIYNYIDKPLTITDSTFDNGGNGHALVNQGNTTITGSTFRNNRGSQGGAIFNVSSEITISDSIFSNNWAYQRGGAIYVGGGQVTISNSSFDGNSALYEGGAIAHGAGTTQVTTSIFTNNQTRDPQYGYGSVMYAHPSGTASISQSCIVGNTNVNPNLYALSVQAGNSTLTATNNWWGVVEGPATLNNTNVDSVGVPYIPFLTLPPANCPTQPLTPIDQTMSVAVETPLDITLSVWGGRPPYTFSINDNPSNGVLSGSAPNLTYTPASGFQGYDSFSFTTTDMDNNAVVATIRFNVGVPASVTINVNSTAQEVPFVVNGNCTLGEAIQAANINASVDACDAGSIFATDIIQLQPDSTYTLNAVDNTSANGANGLPVITGPTTIYGGNATLIRGNGGNYRFFEIANSGSLTLENMTLRMGRSSGDGGAIYNGSGDLTLNTVFFANNTALGNTGGAVLSNGLTFVNYSTFENNTATRGGGAISVGTITVNNSTFTGNRTTTTDGAAGHGGAIKASQVHIYDSVFQGNTANSAGALFASGTQESDIDNSQFIGNTAAQSGAAINNQTKKLTITNTLFTGNSNSNNSSVIYNTSFNGNFSSGHLTMSNSCMVGNPALSTISYAGSVNIDIANNWWGASDGPSGAWPGGGDTLNSNLQAAPFLTVPPNANCPVLPPKVSDQTETTLFNTAKSISLSAKGGLPPYTFTIISGPSQGVLTGTAPNLIYTPNNGTISSDSFVYEVEDSVGGSATATVTINIFSDLNATSQILNTAYQTTTDIMLAATGGTQPYTFNVTSNPEAGTLTGTPPNLTYAPPANFSGTVTLGFTVTDAYGFVKDSTVRIIVAPNLVVANQSLYATPGVSLNIWPYAGGGRTPYTYNVSTPIYGTLTGEAPQLVYRVDNSFSGLDIFTVDVTDANGTTKTLTIRISTAPPMAVQPINVTTAYQTSILTQIQASGGATPYTYNVVSPPAHGTVSGTAPSWIYTPDDGFSGNDSFSYNVVDLNGYVKTGWAYVTVHPQLVFANQNTGVAYNSSADFSLNPASGGVPPYSYSHTSPANGTLTGTFPDFTYTPDSGFSGSDSFSVTVTDSSNAQVTVTVNITVPAPVTIAAGDVDGLIAAINAANPTTAPDTIILTPSTYLLTTYAQSGTLGKNGLPSIGSPIIIIGNGAVIERDSASKFRFFEVREYGNLTLDNVTLRNGNAGQYSQGGSQYDANGGAILNSGQLTLLNSILENNYSDERGGAIYHDGRQLTIRNTTFRNNPVSISSSGAAVAAHGPVTIEDSLFENHTTTYSVVYVTDGDGEISGTRFINNTVSAASAVIVAAKGSQPQAPSVHITMSNSCIVGNNGDGVSEGSSAGFDARNNWWGSAGGPTVNGVGTGQVIDPSVTLYTPFLTTPPMAGCPVLPPVATAQTVRALSETATEFTLDVAGGLPPYSFSITQPPTYGTLTGTAPDLTYTSNSGYTGLDSFTYSVTDSSGGTDEAVVTLEVVTTLQPTDRTLTTAFNTPLDITLSSDSGTQPFTYSVASQPANGLVIGTPPEITYIPDAGFSGSDPFTIETQDSNGAVVTSTITVQVDNPAPATIVVTSTQQEQPFVNNGNCTLGEAIRAAQNNVAVDACNAGTGADIIEVPAGTYNLSIQAELGYALPAVSTEIIIRGAGMGQTILARTGSASMSFLRIVQPAKITFEGMTLYDGGNRYDTSSTVRRGGAIHNSGTLNVINVRIENSHVYNDGGAIYNNDGATLNVYNSVFLNNRAEFRGSAIFNYTNGTVNIQNSLFYNNQTLDGVSIHNYGTGVAQYNCMLDISGNSSYDISSSSSLGSMDARYNWWEPDGIGLRVTAGVQVQPLLQEPPEICFPTYRPNIDVAAGDVAGLVSALQYAQTLEGPITINLAPGSAYTLTQPYSTSSGTPPVTRRVVINGNGATIQRSYQDGTPNFRILGVAGGNLTINDLTVSNGRATNGSGLSVNNNSQVVLNRVRFLDHATLGGGLSGGTLYANGSGINLTVNDSWFENNTSIYGAGIATFSATLNVNNTVFTGNAATTGGSSIAIMQGINIALNNNCFLDNAGVSVYTDQYNNSSNIINAANNWWGATDGPSGEGLGSGDVVGPRVIYEPFLAAPPAHCPVLPFITNDQSLTTNYFESLNVMLSAKGGVPPYTFATGDEPANGTLTGTAPNLTYTPDEGFMGTDTFTFSVTDMLATTVNGTINIQVIPSTIYVDSAAQEVPFVVNGNCTLGEAIQAANTDSAVDACAAGSARDIIELADNASYVLAQVDNSADGANGLPTITSTVVINGHGSTISRSQAQNTPLLRFFHVNDNGSLELNNLTLSNGNVHTGTMVTGAGGAIYSKGDLILNNITLLNNRASAGGGVFTDANNRNLEISSSSFSSNSAYSGGGLWTCSITTIDSSTFNGNSADLDGGGIYTRCSTPINITNTTIVNNSAYLNGGGIYNQSANIQMDDVIFEGNDAPEGASLFNEDGYSIPNITAVNSCFLDIEAASIYDQLWYGGIEAVNNWWGSDSGPGGDGGGYGSPIEGENILYTPFLTAPILGCGFLPPQAVDQSIELGFENPVNITLTASSGNPPYSFAVATLPQNGTLTGAAPDLTYTPDDDFSGLDSFTFTVTDANDETATGTIELRVDEQLIAGNYTVSTNYQVPIPVDLWATGGYGTVSFALLTQPENGTLSGTIPSLTYTPNAEFSGTDAFTFSATDTINATSTGTITIQVGAALAGGNQQLETLPNVALSLTLTASGGSAPYTFAITTPPANGAVIGSGTQRTYIPANDFAGTDSFTFTVTDDVGGTAQGTITIEVSPLLTAIDQQLETLRNNSLVVTLAASGGNEPYTFEIGAQPTQGTLSGTGANLNYSPDTDFVGTDSFTFTVTDDRGKTDTGTVAITVYQELTAGSKQVYAFRNIALPISLPVTGGFTPYSFDITVNPAYGAVSGNGQDVTYIPATNFTGTDSFTFSVTDDRGATSTGTITVVVTATSPTTPPPAPAIQLLTASNDTTPTFQWAEPAAPGGPFTYLVQLDDDPLFRSPLVQEETIVTQFTPDAPLSEGQWNWRVQAISANEIAGKWRTTRTIVDTTAPAAPLLARPSNEAVVGTAQPVVSWRGVSTAVQYQVQIWSNPDFNGDPLVDVITRSRSLKSPVVLPQGIYYWRALAIDRAGNQSEFSQAFTFRVNLQRKPIRDGAVTDTTPTFQWYRLNQATAYQLQVARDEDFNTLVFEYTSENNRILGYTPIEALDYGVYYWRVNVDMGGTPVMSPFTWKFTVTQRLPPTPRPLTPGSTSTDTTPEFTWSAVPVDTLGGPFIYQIQIDDDPRFGSPAQDEFVDGTSYSADEITPGRYYWRVRVVNALGVPTRWSSVRRLVIEGV